MFVLCAVVEVYGFILVFSMYTVQNSYHHSSLPTSFLSILETFHNYIDYRLGQTHKGHYGYNFGCHIIAVVFWGRSQCRYALGEGGWSAKVLGLYLSTVTEDIPTRYLFTYFL